MMDRKMLSTGVVVAIGLMVHNFPEGAAVFLSSVDDLRMGLLLFLAIMIHNIPEGIAVAAPIYHASGSRKKAIKYAFISGLAEPLGAVLAYLFLTPYLDEKLLASIFAVVAGVMVYISFDELLPACFRNGNGGHREIGGIVLGMGIVFLSLLVI